MGSHRDHLNEKTPRFAGLSQYRYRDSNPGFRRERALDSDGASGNVRYLQGKLLRLPTDKAAKCTPDVCCECADDATSAA